MAVSGILCCIARFVFEQDAAPGNAKALQEPSGQFGFGFAVRKNFSDSAREQNSHGRIPPRQTCCGGQPVGCWAKFYHTTFVRNQSVDDPSKHDYPIGLLTAAIHGGNLCSKGRSMTRPAGEYAKNTIKSEMAAVNPKPTLRYRVKLSIMPAKHSIMRTLEKVARKPNVFEATKNCWPFSSRVHSKSNFRRTPAVCSGRLISSHKTWICIDDDFYYLSFARRHARIGIIKVHLTELTKLTRVAAAAPPRSVMNSHLRMPDPGFPLPVGRRISCLPLGR